MAGSHLYVEFVGIIFSFIFYRFCEIVFFVVVDDRRLAPLAIDGAEGYTQQGRIGGLVTHIEEQGLALAVAVFPVVTIFILFLTEMV